jgi:hypothetical protein
VAAGPWRRRRFEWPGTRLRHRIERGDRGGFEDVLTGVGDRRNRPETAGQRELAARFCVVVRFVRRRCEQRRRDAGRRRPGAAQQGTRVRLYRAGGRLRLGTLAKTGGGGVPAPDSGQAWRPGPDGPSTGPRRAGGSGWLGCGS